MADTRSTALAFAAENRAQFRSKLEELIAIPSISTDPEYHHAIERAAGWLADELRRLGATSVEILPTAGKPIVWGEIPAGAAATLDKNSPTILVYGHYDVQPVDPVELWHSEPFVATERDGALYARGASDMKGQVMATLSALDAIRSAGPLPVNVRFLLEGEEEIGSPSLQKSIDQYADRFAADLCLNPDTGMIAPDLPTITYGLRGLAYFEVRLRGPAHDLHSGIFGGAVENPAHALCDLIAGLHDENGRVTLPGFYERVRELTAEERDELARLPMDDEFYLKQTGAPRLYGENGYTVTERIGARPTLEINGIVSGFTGKGAKTVLPSTAMAKISTRLVPDQDPGEVRDMLSAYFDAFVPPTMTHEIEVISLGPPLITERDNRGNRALAAALEAVWGSKPMFKREGGSVPVSTYLERQLGVPSVLTGFGLPDDNLHAPNEKLDLPTWYRGIDALIHFFYNVAAQW
ncbi:MAG: dipeptidase [Spirochaetaceae bacterium]|nr:MAG: dipeptidase [Spirochaetaceae bacterium]